MTSTAAPSIAAGTAKPAGLAAVQKYFATSDYNMAQFRSDWSKLTDKDKTDLRNGLGDGTLTY
jgi:predicted component of type VI protein secretion system